MAPTNLQQRTHALQVGVPINPPIDLKVYCPQGTSFASVRTSRPIGSQHLPNGLTLSSDGIITGTPTASGASAAVIRAYRGTRNPDLSWAARRSGCYNSERFDTDVVTERGQARAAYDTSVKRSGAGSLRIFKNAGDSHAAGQYGGWFWSTRVPQATVVNPNTGLKTWFTSNAGFGAGEEFYIQFAVRPNDAYCRSLWPPDPKIAILQDLPWATNPNLGATSRDWEIVVTNHENALYGYLNSPSGPGWQQWGYFNGGADALYAPALGVQARTLNGDSPGLPSNTGTTWSAGQQLRAARGPIYSYMSSSGSPDGRPDPLMYPGPAFSSDQWHTILMRVKNGTGTPTPNTVAVPDGGSGGLWAWANPGILEVWIAQEGQDYVKLFSATPRMCTGVVNGVGRTSSPFYCRENNVVDGQDTTYGGLFLTNLDFGYDLVGMAANAMWYDELICSPSFIPAPDFDGTSNYRSSDAIVTFKVAP